MLFLPSKKATAANLVLTEALMWPKEESRYLMQELDCVNS